MKKANIIELQVAPSGIRDIEGRIPPIKLEDANQLLGLFREDEIILQAYDNFSVSTFPREYEKISSVIQISKGRIKWQLSPKDELLRT